MVQWLTVLAMEALVDQHLILGPHMKVVEKSLHKVILSSPHVHHGVGDIYTLLSENKMSLGGSC